MKVAKLSISNFVCQDVIVCFGATASGPCGLSVCGNFRQVPRELVIVVVESYVWSPCMRIAVIRHNEIRCKVVFGVKLIWLIETPRAIFSV